MASREVTKAEADKKAAEVKNQQDLQKAIMAEAKKITFGQTHSVQMLMAYGRQLWKSADEKGK